MKDILNRNDTLAVSSNGRNNNLNIIRFVAALMVIFGHSYAATYSYSLGDPLHRLTLNQLDFGGLAVSIFFTFGGFLICKSMIIYLKVYYRIHQPWILLMQSVFPESVSQSDSEYR